MGNEFIRRLQAAQEAGRGLPVSSERAMNFFNASAFPRMINALQERFGSTWVSSSLRQSSYESSIAVGLTVIENGDVLSKKDYQGRDIYRNDKTVYGKALEFKVASSGTITISYISWSRYPEEEDIVLTYEQWTGNEKLQEDAFIAAYTDTNPSHIRNPLYYSDPYDDYGSGDQ
jgi:hypothetical protein